MAGAERAAKVAATEQMVVDVLLSSPDNVRAAMVTVTDVDPQGAADSGQLVWVDYRGTVIPVPHAAGLTVAVDDAVLLLMVGASPVIAFRVVGYPPDDDTTDGEDD